jgi:hypothetical protein
MIGDEPVDAQVQEAVHLVLLVDRPGDHLDLRVMGPREEPPGDQAAWNLRGELSAVAWRVPTPEREPHEPADADRRADARGWSSTGTPSAVTLTSVSR